MGHDKPKSDKAMSGDDDIMDIDNENENENESEDLTIMDEEEMKQIQDGEQRFKDLLAKATTTSNITKKVNSSTATAAAPKNKSLMNTNLMKPAMMSSSMGIGFDTGDDNDPQLGLGRSKHHQGDASGTTGGLGLGMKSASEHTGGGLGLGMKSANGGGSSFEPSSGGLGLGMSSSSGMGLGMGGGIGNNTSSVGGIGIVYFEVAIG